MGKGYKSIDRRKLDLADVTATKPDGRGDPKTKQSDKPSGPKDEFTTSPPAAPRANGSALPPIARTSGSGNGTEAKIRALIETSLDLTVPNSKRLGAKKELNTLRVSHPNLVQRIAFDFLSGGTTAVHMPDMDDYDSEDLLNIPTGVRYAETYAALIDRDEEQMLRWTTTESVFISQESKAARDGEAEGLRNLLIAAGDNIHQINFVTTAYFRLLRDHYFNVEEAFEELIRFTTTLLGEDISPAAQRGGTKMLEWLAEYEEYAKWSGSEEPIVESAELIAYLSYFGFPEKFQKMLPEAGMAFTGGLEVLEALEKKRDSVKNTPAVARAVESIEYHFLGETEGMEGVEVGADIQSIAAASLSSTADEGAYEEARIAVNGIFQRIADYSAVRSMERRKSTGKHFEEAVVPVVEEDFLLETDVIEVLAALEKAEQAKPGSARELFRKNKDSIDVLIESGNDNDVLLSAQLCADVVHMFNLGSEQALLTSSYIREETLRKDRRQDVFDVVYPTLASCFEPGDESTAKEIEQLKRLLSSGPLEPLDGWEANLVSRGVMPPGPLSERTKQSARKALKLHGVDVPVDGGDGNGGSTGRGADNEAQGDLSSWVPRLLSPQMPVQGGLYFINTPMMSGAPITQHFG